jgi:hypothetical protein
VAKWLVYITLVVVAGIIIGDLVAVLASLLRGELTGRFILKALTVLAIASSIFGYYLWSLQRKVDRNPSVIKLFIGFVAIAVISTVVYGLTLVGSPSEQRSRQLDERRVNELQQITFAIDEYWRQNAALPSTLEDLRDRRFFVDSLTDPITGEPYEYNVLDEEAYELCSVFETDSSGYERPLPRPVSEQLWEHGIGRTCFELEVRKTTERPKL